MITARALVQESTEAISAAGCDDPRADAGHLVCAVLGMSAAELSDDGATPVSPEQRERVLALVRRRVEREPIAYILGSAKFRGIELAVDPRVLIPREETGLLVEEAVKLPQGARVHEVGTGSGAVALALLSERPDLRVTASDLSPEAAEVARENAERLGLPLEVTVAAGLPSTLDDEVDLVLANLPYVTDETIYERSPEIRREPRIAVTGACGSDGLGVIRGLVEEAPSGWWMALEHDTHHGPAMRAMLRDAATMRDHMGGERVTVGRAP